MRRSRHRLLAFGLASVLAGSGLFASTVAVAKSQPAFKATATKPAPNLVERLQKSGKFTTLITAVQAAGLGDTLANTKDLTVFAPTDAAFAKIPSDQLAKIVGDKALLTSILTYHVSPKVASAKSLAKASSVATLNGATVSVSGKAKRLVLNGNVKVINADVRVSNGIIHYIDTVLVPPAPPVVLKDVVDTAIGAGSFKTLVAAVQAAGLEQTLRTTQNITVFAPTDDAFAKLGDATIKGLLADKAALTKILTYHVAGKVITAADIVSTSKGTFTTLQGQDVTYEVVGGNVILNGNIKVVATDIKASNGIIHVIDTVLVPAAPPTPPTTIAPPTTVAPVAPVTTVPQVTAVPTQPTTAPPTVPPTTAAPVVLKDVVDTAIGAGSFKTLVAAVQAAGLEQTLRTTQNITVFAPTDDAFAKLGDATIKGLLADKAALTKILTYHVTGKVITAADIVSASKGTFTTLQGQDVTYEVVGGNVILNGNIKVVATDIKASNGIIHVIDTVLVPAAPPVVLKDVVDTAIGAGSFKTLVAAVQAAGLEQTLRTTQNITVFAPTDDAFAKLGDATIKGLLADKAALTKILTYHVAGKVITAADIVKATKGTFTTLQGQDVTYEVVHGNVILNGHIKVVATDIKASNGIIHVIDTVLVPPAPKH